MNHRTFLGNFARLAESPGGIDSLRELVLQLAVTGKLLPQCPDDHSASDLLDEIKHMRDNLVQEGKLPRGKANLPLRREALPFEIPRSWSWAKLSNIMEKMGAGSTPLGGKKVYAQDGVMFLRSQNVWNDGLRLDDVARISVQIHGRMSGTAVQPGDVLLNITGASIGRCAVVPDLFAEANVSQHVAILRLIDKRLRQFLHLCIISPFFQKTIMDVQVGVSREGLSMARLREFPLPVPPLPEQARIVAKVHELMSLCNELECRQQQRHEMRNKLNDAALDRLVTTSEVGFTGAWQRVHDNFDLLYAVPENVAKLRQTILQLAVQGKLERQDPRDEPAAPVVDRVIKERHELAKTGKVKYASPSRALSRDHVTFTFPGSWELRSLGELLVFGPTNGISPKPVDQVTNVKSLTLTATTSGVFNPLHVKHLACEVPPDSPLWLQDGDILIQRSNTAQYVGVAAVYHGAPRQFVYPDLMMKLRVAGSLNVDYVHLVLNCEPSREFYRRRATGTSGSMRKINQAVVCSLPVPIPPAAEQKRIVARVKDLMALCDDLEVKLKRRREHAYRVTRAVVNAAINGTTAKARTGAV